MGFRVKRILERITPLVEDTMEREETNEQGAVRDILTDLRHYAAAHGVDFDMAIEGSLTVMEEEIVMDKEDDEDNT